MTMTEMRSLRQTFGRPAIATSLLAALGLLLRMDAGEALLPALLILAVGVLTVAWAPSAGVAAALMAAPTMFQLQPMPRGSFSLLEIATLVAAAGTGLALLWRLRREGIGTLRVLLVPPEIAVPVVLLVLATAVALSSLADPSYRTESLREVRLVIVEPLIFLGTALVVLRESAARTWAATMLIATGAAISVGAVGEGLMGNGGVEIGAVTRATVTYPGPNNLAFFLERTLLLTAGVALRRPRWWPVWLLAAIQLAGVLATFSRGALLAVAAGVALILLLTGTRRRWVVLGAAAAGVGALAFIIARDRLIDAGVAGSEPTRFTIWRASARMIADHALTGVGPDQFLYQYWRRYVEPVGWQERYTSHPHNLVLDVWLRLGVLGLAAFATLAVGVVRLLVAGLGRLRSDPVAAGALAALAGGLVHGMVDNGFFLADLATLTWFFVACIGTMQPARKISDGPDRAAA